MPPLASTVLRTEVGVYQYREWENISVGVWVGQAQRESVLGLLDIITDMRARHPEGHSSMVFILDQLPAPAPEAQALLTKIFSAAGHELYTGIVLEGTGFWASGLRAMLGNTHRAATDGMQIRIATSLSELIPWFCHAHTTTTEHMVPQRQMESALLRVRDMAEAGARGKPT